MEEKEQRCCICLSNENNFVINNDYFDCNCNFDYCLSCIENPNVKKCVACPFKKKGNKPREILYRLNHNADDYFQPRLNQNSLLNNLQSRVNQIIPLSNQNTSLNNLQSRVNQIIPLSNQNTSSNQSTPSNLRYVENGSSTQSFFIQNEVQQTRVNQSTSSNLRYEKNGSSSLSILI